MRLFLAVLLAVSVEFSKAQEFIFPTEQSEIRNFGQCITPNNQQSLCVYLQDCEVLFTLLHQSPLPNEDKVYLRRHQCGYFQGTVLVCCPPANRDQPTVTNPTPTRPVYIEPTPNIPTRSSGLLPEPGITCGSGIFDRIYGGNDTKIDEFPWMALLAYSKTGNRIGYHCGGALINERYVITASHCVNGKAIPGDWRLSGVRLGEWDTSTDQDCEEDDCSDPVVDVAIEQAIPHENYNPSSKNQHNDIALLRLAQRVRFTDWVKPVCLPVSSYLRTATLEGNNLDVAGWGKTEKSAASNIKLKARVDAVSLDQCNSVYSRQGVTIQGNQLCAGGVKGIDSCRGDSGGPLMGIDNNNVRRPYYYLAGIVSYGPTPCGLEGWPGVYTRIGAYIDWIESKLSP